MRTLFLTDWRAPDGTIVGTALRDGATLERSYLMTDIRADDPVYQERVRAWVDRCRANGDKVRDLRTTPDAELVQLHDGPEVQHLVPGVQPVSHAAREIAALRQRREARRGAAPLPSGGLFDAVAVQQQELF